MKYTKTAIFLFFSILAQMSFLRLMTIFPVLPDVPLVVLLVSSYRLPRFGFLVLAALAGAAIDLFSAGHFGISIFALVMAFIVCYYIREKFLKAKNFGNIVLCCFIVSACFYLLFFGGERLLDYYSGNNTAINLIDIKIAFEIILTVLFAAAIVYFLENKINYANIRDYKKYFKISA